MEGKSLQVRTLPAPSSAHAGMELCTSNVPCNHDVTLWQQATKYWQQSTLRQRQQDTTMWYTNY